MLGRRRGEDEVRSSKFEFHRRTQDDITERASRRISEFDSLYIIPVRNFKATQGENRVRFLPATWPQAKHYGYDIYVHRNIGPDNTRYYCRKRMLNERCVLCDEQYILQKEGATDEAAELKPQARVISWVINRSAESEGPLIWEMSASQDLDIASLQANKRTGDIFLCDDPEEGFDLSFTRQGTTLKTTRYRGWQFDRAATALSDDHEQMQMWLTFIQDNPIPDILKFYDNDYVSKVFYPSAETTKEEREPREPLRRTATPERAGPPTARASAKPEEPRQSVKEELDDEIPPFNEAEEEEVVQPARTQARSNGEQRPHSNGEEQPARSRSRATSKPVEEEEEADEGAPPDDDVSARMRDRLSRMSQRRQP